MAENDKTPQLGLYDDKSPLFRTYFQAGSRDETEFKLTRILSLCARRWGTYVEQRMLAATGQDRARWQTLFIVNIATGPVTTSMLSARLAIKWPPLVRTLNGLEADGLIKRVENPEDRRSRFIEITPAGMAVVEKVQPALSKIRSAVFSDVSEQEMHIATAVLEKIVIGVARAQGEEPDS